MEEMVAVAKGTVVVEKGVEMVAAAMVAVAMAAAATAAVAMAH